MAPTLQHVDHIHVFVSDRAASEQWYDKVMGFRRLNELEFWATDGGPLTIANPSGTIHLALFERAAERCRSTIAFAADATQFLAWHVHLTKALARSIEPVDHQLSWSLYFTDPDRNPFEVTSYEHAALASKLTKTAAEVLR